MICIAYIDRWGMEYIISQMVKYTNLINNEALNNLFFIWYFSIRSENCFMYSTSSIYVHFTIIVGFEYQIICRMAATHFIFFIFQLHIHHIYKLKTCIINHPE